MGYEHFYLGNVQKFKFYMDRYEKGTCEEDQSLLKRMFESAEQSQQRALNVSSNRVRNKSIMKLPSPSQFANKGNSKSRIFCKLSMM